MFYCESCRKKKGYPESMNKSYGKCEICGNQAVCHEVASKHLPKKGEPESVEGWSGGCNTVHKAYNRIVAGSRKKHLAKIFRKRIDGVPYYRISTHGDKNLRYAAARDYRACGYSVRVLGDVIWIRRKS